MPHRHVTNRLKFLLERLVLRGAHYRLLIIGALIGLLSLMAGVIVFAFGAGLEGGLGNAVWWAFLRLSDPGYLGDDEGTLLRLVSTVLTVLGYVVFLGSLVAIMTQWLNQRMRALEAGLTPIAQRDHVLIIGWTSRTPTIVQELVMAGSRMRRFLQLHGTRSLRIAILADEVTTELGIELRDRLGRLWNERQVILRTGSPLRLEHLERVAFIHAAAVIVPAADVSDGGPDQVDARTIKTLLSMTNHPQRGDVSELPLAVAEVLDARRIDIARRAYGGPVEILASDAIVSRLIAQNVRHPGLSHIFGELLTHGRGNEIYVRDCGELQGTRFGELPPRFEEAIALGIVRRHGASYQPLLNPPPETVLRPEDRIALVARSYASTAPASGGAAPPGSAGSPLEPAPAAGPGPHAAAPAARPTPRTPPRRVATDRPLRVLLLGWSHKVPALLREFDSYTDESFAIDIVSTTSAAHRQSTLQRYGVQGSRMEVNQIEADFATPSVLQQVDVTGYDSIVLVGSDRFDSGEESDARSIIGYLLLRDLLPERGGPAVLIELLDPGNLPLFRKRATEVIVTPVILSHMLAQVALRPELRAVFDELFGPGGAEIVFRSPAVYGLGGKPLLFRDVEAAARSRGEIALGIRTVTPGTEVATFALNPPRDQQWTPGAEDEVISLTTY
jgi:ion channel POLLUX/CASTOR